MVIMKPAAGFYIFMVERRWGRTIFFLYQNFYLIIMDKQETIIKVEEKTIIEEIKETPFQHVTKNEKQYITCGRTIMQVDMNKEDVENWLEEKPWELIAMLAQSICYEMLNEKK